VHIWQLAWQSKQEVEDECKICWITNLCKLSLRSMFDQDKHSDSLLDTKNNLSRKLNTVCCRTFCSRLNSLKIFKNKLNTPDYFRKLSLLSMFYRGKNSDSFLDTKNNLSRKLSTVCYHILHSALGMELFWERKISTNKSSLRQREAASAEAERVPLGHDS